MIGSPRLNFLVITLLVGLPLLALSGCGGAGSTIQGNVTFDGQPVDGGMISFFSSGEAKGADKAHAEIKEGKFSGKGPPPGSYRVEIVWDKKTGKGDPDLASTSSVQVIPPKYNKDSTLNETVKSGVNTFNYDLKSR